MDTDTNTGPLDTGAARTTGPIHNGPDTTTEPVDTGTGATITPANKWSLVDPTVNRPIKTTNTSYAQLRCIILKASSCFPCVHKNQHDVNFIIPLGPSRQSTPSCVAQTFEPVWTVILESQNSKKEI